MTGGESRGGWNWRRKSVHFCELAGAGVNVTVMRLIAATATLAFKSAPSPRHFLLIA